MKNIQKVNAYVLGSSLVALTVVSSQVTAEDAVTQAIKAGKASVDFRLRYEGVDQDNALKDANALTLRTRLGYTTGELNGFSAMVEIEDSRIVADVDEYTVGPTGFHTGEYSVVADPETTEVDQAYLQYKKGSLTTKLGRQVITYDNHRFIGHVGWRQDRQTFDAFTVAYSPMENLSLNYGYINERERIFAEDADLDSNDHLFNVSYKTPFGKLTGYSYLLEQDVDGGDDIEIDTYGVRLNGAKESGEMKVLYTLEYADQEREVGTADNDADYTFVEAGAVVKGITAKVGYEVLSSDDSSYGFSTPLATGHKFNGWSDQFLSTPDVGLEDLSVTLSAMIVGGKLAVIYHDFEAEDGTATIDDLGDELNLVFTKKITDNYSAGIKYADYDAGDSAAGKVDTEKVWVWLGAKF